MNIHDGRTVILSANLYEDIGAGGGSRRASSSPSQVVSTTQKIRSIGREARQNQLISERLSHWKADMRERGPTSTSNVLVLTSEHLLLGESTAGTQRAITKLQDCVKAFRPCAHFAHRAAGAVKSQDHNMPCRKLCG